MSAPPLFAVVLAGGSGTRFWPASREQRPKQFLSLTGEQPLIERTCTRLEGLVPWERILVVAPEAQAELVRAALPRLPRENLVLEPFGRNTAACVALAALHLADRHRDSVQLVLPADHFVEPVEALRRSLAIAAEEAAAGDSLITFGIRPRYPATGYGYIELGEEVWRRDGAPIHAVQRFVEKPDRTRAEGFLATGRFLWNSGMFAWRTHAVLDAFRRFGPELVRALEDGRAKGTLSAAYQRLPSVPVDVAILERAPNVRVLPIEFTWSDVGSWNALAEVLAPDASGNYPALRGGAQHIALDSEGCVVFGDGPEVIATIGVGDLIVVRAGDATLVCPRDRAEDVKKIVERLRDQDGRWT
jgi:mannose-1-phosphate guanylyltransferase